MTYPPRSKVMLWPNDVKEELSLAYVHAVACRAGFSVEGIRRDRDSIDLKILARGRLADDSVLESPELSVQLKATASAIGSEPTFPFDLSLKNYDDLRKTVLVPRVLVVFVMPEDEGRWVEMTEDALLLRHRAYWTCLLGSPESINTKQQRVHLSRQSVVNPECLSDLLVRVSREETLKL